MKLSGSLILPGRGNPIPLLERVRLSAVHQEPFGVPASLLLGGQTMIPTFQFAAQRGNR